MPFGCYTGWSYMMGGGFGMVIFWILIVLGIIYLLNNTGLINKNNNNYQKDKKKPIEIARKRYAEGEISKDEFEEIKENLRK